MVPAKVLTGTSSEGDRLADIIIISTQQDLVHSVAATLYISSKQQLNFYGICHTLCPCLSSEEKH